MREGKAGNKRPSKNVRKNLLTKNSQGFRQMEVFWGGQKNLIGTELNDLETFLVLEIECFS